jgi:hypothetical protein
MMMPETPTLIHTTTVNSAVCDVAFGFARVRYPDGNGQIVNEHYKDAPRQLRDLLFDWLSAHVDAVRAEYDHDHSPPTKEAAPCKAADILEFLERDDIRVCSIGTKQGSVDVHSVHLMPNHVDWIFRGRGANVIEAAREAIVAEEKYLG